MPMGDREEKLIVPNRVSQGDLERRQAGNFPPAEEGITSCNSKSFPILSTTSGCPGSGVDPDRSHGSLWLQYTYAKSLTEKCRRGGDGRGASLGLGISAVPVVSWLIHGSFGCSRDPMNPMEWIPSEEARPGHTGHTRGGAHTSQTTGRGLLVKHNFSVASPTSHAHNRCE